MQDRVAQRPADFLFPYILRAAAITLKWAMIGWWLALANRRAADYCPL